MPDLIDLFIVDAYDESLSSPETTLYFCTGEGFITRPEETPANTTFLPRVENPGLTREDIFSKGTTGGASTMGHGQVVLTNLDGGLDSLIDFGFDGRQMVHRVGPARRGWSINTVYEFTNDHTGWTANNATLADESASVLLTATGSNPSLDSPVLSLAGKRAQVVRARVRRTAGGAADELILQYSTGGHGFSTSYQKAAKAADDPTAWHVLTWDMADLDAGGTDWLDNTITGLNFQFSNDSGDIWEIDWVTIYELTAIYPDDYPVVETFTMEQLRFTWDKIKVVVRDKQLDFDKPLQTNLYLGNNSLPNGIEGVATDLKGKPKPLAFGHVYNVTLPCVNTSKLIYQLTDSGIDSTVASEVVLYDQGVAITEDAAGDYASQAAMETTAPAAGQFRIWPAGGCVRLGSTPNGEVTADFKEGSGGDTDRYLGQLIDRIVTLAGLGSGVINTSDIANADTYGGGVCGLMVEGEETTRKVLDRICQTAGLWWSFDEDGVFRVQQLIAPTAGASVATFTTTDIRDNISREPETGDGGRGLPVWKVTVSYKKNHTVQRDADLAGAVSTVRRAELAEEWLTATATDASVKTKHPQAAELFIESAANSESDAQAEADRLLVLKKVRRDRLNIEVLSAAADGLKLGNVVTVSLDRFGFGAGKPFVIIGRQPNYSLGRVSLTLWG